MFLLQLAATGLCIALLPLSYVWIKASDDKFRKLVWVTTFLTLDLIMFGGFTRLTDSGLGCPDWPGCYGTASPFLAHAQIAAAHAAMPSGPVSLMKAWIEMIHRYFAMAIGVLIIAQTASAWVARIKRKSLTVSPWWPTSLLLLIRRAARPHVAFGAGRTGVLVIRVDASLLYFNAEHVLEIVWTRLRSAASVRQVVCDLSSSPHVDLAGARMLSRLRRELRAAAIDFRLTGANEAVRDVIRAEGPLVESLDEVDCAAGDGAPRQEAQHVRN